MVNVPDIYKSSILLKLLIVIFCLSSCTISAAQVDEQAKPSPISLQTGTVIEFADVETGKKIMTAKDEYINTVGPFNRSMALQTDKPVALQEYIDFMGKQVLEWTETEKEILTESVERVSELMSPFKLRLPEKIMFVKSTGLDMVGCAYCRPCTVVFPVTMLNQIRAEEAITGSFYTMDYLVVHELFHVYSACNKSLHDEMYGLIGYKKFPGVKLPEKLNKITFSNPDYPVNNYYVEFEYKNETVQAMPLCYSNTPSYDKNRMYHLAFYYTQGLLLIEKVDGKWQCRMKDGEPVILSQLEAWNYFAIIGFNTMYTLDPEEVITENWCCIALAEPPYQTPEIIEKLKVFLQKHANEIEQN